MCKKFAQLLLFFIQIYDPQHQVQYDKNLQASDSIPLRGMNAVRITYTQNKKQYAIQSRDFYEKGFCFFHNGKLYRYSCSINDSEKTDEKYDGSDITKKALPDNKTVRGFTIYNCGIFQRENDGRITGVSIT